MTRIAAALAALALAVAAAPASAQVSIENPWARATPPGAKVGGGFMKIVNKGAADRLVGASSEVAARVETHVHRHENGVMKMIEVPGFDVPAGGSVELKPGGAHLMFMELKRALKAGERVAVTLKFEKAGEVKAEFAVAAMGASGPAGAGGHGGHKH